MKSIRDVSAIIYAVYLLIVLRIYSLFQYHGGRGSGAFEAITTVWWIFVAVCEIVLFVTIDPSNNHLMLFICGLIVTPVLIHVNVMIALNGSVGFKFIKASQIKNLDWFKKLPLGVYAPKHQVVSWCYDWCTYEISPGRFVQGTNCFREYYNRSSVDNDSRIFYIVKLPFISFVVMNSVTLEEHALNEDVLCTISALLRWRVEQYNRAYGDNNDTKIQTWDK